MLRIQDSIVQMLRIQDSIVQMLRIQECSVQMLRIQECSVQMLRSQECSVQMLRIQDSIVQMLRIQESIVQMLRIQDSIVRMLRIQELSGPRHRPSNSPCLQLVLDSPIVSLSIKIYRRVQKSLPPPPFSLVAFASLSLLQPETVFTEGCLGGAC
ncbi:hypothetical protein AVEN_182783-1 [Araneus ventricosus]|uniref:Uncharacterized protein n=1 Tax=Araneus ventricosus TaxID=182803 RepID=A0A4Y2GZX1_ARAVE|nr:hypothetical protein AVEN_80959-1 [Araneus ventricosus]GBM58385.1 hypothetical protein AVEN_182783-1 [Araneus ventricosus]